MPFPVEHLTIGGPELFLIAGPCVIESEEHALFMATSIAAICWDLGIPFIFKASYDKANRTSLTSYRGPGLADGLRILSRIRHELNIPVLTDIHEAAHAEAAATAVDILQIPAFLCRQTDLLVAAARTGCAINIKKGQFVAPQDMRHAVEKIQQSGNERVSLTERGSCFGYHNLVVDMRSLAIMREIAPVVFDATHSVQLPSQGTQSGGQPEFIPLLARAAVAAGIDGLFLEVHDNPPVALSDGTNSLPLANLKATLQPLLAIRKALITT
jgi:2-dehydro-3-deoxyphosphooctonate aldolase (KDO 8-P synthase)